MQALEGKILEGTVTSVKEFGAFVEIDIGDGQVLDGMVHVSEISEQFIENIFAHVAEGDVVEVAIMSVRDDGKVDLSMKRADPDWLDEEVPDLKPKDGKDFNRKLRRFMHTSQRSNGLRRRQKRSRLNMNARR